MLTSEVECGKLVHLDPVVGTSIVLRSSFHITQLMVNQPTLCGKQSMFNHLQIYFITPTIRSGASASSRVHSGLRLVIVGNTAKRSVTSEPLNI